MTVAFAITPIPRTFGRLPRSLFAALAMVAAVALPARAEDVPAGVSEARAIVEAHRANPTFWAPPAFDAAPARGKTVWWISDSNTNILKQWAILGQQAAEDAGLNFKLFDATGGAVPEQVRGLDLAIAAKADAIVIGTGYPAVAFAAQVAAAKAAGIPVFSINSHPTGPDAPANVDGLIADVSYDYPGAGKLLADWFVADSGGKGHVLLVDITGLPSAGWTLEGFRAEVARLKVDAKISEAASSLSPAIQTDLANTARTALLRDPDIGYIIPPFDDFALFVQTGLTQAGPAGAKVKTAGFNAVLTQVTNLKTGGTPLAIDLGGPNQWFSYAVIDNVLRALTGQEIVRDYNFGFKVFDHENTQGIDTTKEVSTDWYGADYAALFKEVWGVK